MIAASRLLLLQLEIPIATVAIAADVAARAGVPVWLNAAPAPEALPDAILARVDTLIVNEGEASALAGIAVSDVASALEAARRLRARGPRCVCVTLGERGAVLASHAGEIHRPAPRVDVVDTTAAGDAFTGALAVAWGEGRPLVEAVRWANAAGAACVRHVGASNALPTRDAIDALYASGTPG